MNAGRPPPGPIAGRPPLEDPQRRDTGTSARPEPLAWLTVRSNLYGDSLSEPIAEYTLMMILSIVRRLPLGG